MSKNNIPKEHQLRCDTCGEIIDMRDLGQVASHGLWDGVNETNYCNTEPGEKASVIKNNEPINLN